MFLLCIPFVPKVLLVFVKYFSSNYVYVFVFVLVSNCLWFHGYWSRVLELLHRSCKICGWFFPKLFELVRQFKSEDTTYLIICFSQFQSISEWSCTSKPTIMLCLFLTLTREVPFGIVPKQMWQIHLCYLQKQFSFQVPWKLKLLLMDHQIDKPFERMFYIWSNLSNLQVRIVQTWISRIQLLSVCHVEHLYFLK